MPPLEEHSRWTVPEDLWLDVGDDFVFICRSAHGEERWFRLRQDYAHDMLDAACGASQIPLDGILAAYLQGLGPWGDEPWIAPDFHAVLVALARASGRMGRHDPSAADAHQELLAFLRHRCLAGDRLIVDDGSGQTNRFPVAEAGWTETGKPLRESTLVKYPRDHDILSPLVSFAITAKQLEGLANGVQEVAAFLSDSKRPYTRLKDLSALLRAVSGLDPAPTDLYSFVSEAESTRAIIILQSAGRFPMGEPTR